MVEIEQLDRIAKKEIASEIGACRACGSQEISDVFGLGNIKVARFSGADSSDLCAPLTFCWCKECTYLQLRHNIDLPLVFYPDYGYESGVNPVMVKELGDIVASASDVVKLSSGDKWLDIACNDGTLLLQTEGDIHRVGFDPSRGVAVKGMSKLIEKFGARNVSGFINYFDKRAWTRRFGEEKAKVITAIAVFYSVQNPRQFLDDVREVLDPEGVFVVQQNYTPAMVAQNAFCNIVHEHVTYPTMYSFNRLLESHGLKALDVRTNDINGGSFRVYVGHRDTNVYIEGGEERVLQMLEGEKRTGFLTKDAYQDFGRCIEENGRLVGEYLKGCVDRGEKVYGLAASTRGNTRLQVWNIGPNILRGIADKNPRKIGKKTLGIPIISDSEVVEDADVLLVSIWYFGGDIIQDYKQFLEKGGKMLFPSSANGEPFIAEMRDGEIKKTSLRNYDQKT